MNLTSILCESAHVSEFDFGKKKGPLYIQLDMEELMNQLSPVQTMEISEAHIGQYQKLPARVIIHRLTKEQTEKRLKEQAKKKRRKVLPTKNEVNG